MDMEEHTYYKDGFEYANSAIHDGVDKLVYDFEGLCLHVFIHKPVKSPLSLYICNYDMNRDDEEERWREVFKWKFSLRDIIDDFINTYAGVDKDANYPAPEKIEPSDLPKDKDCYDKTFIKNMKAIRNELQALVSHIDACLEVTKRAFVKKD